MFDERTFAQVRALAQTERATFDRAHYPKFWIPIMGVIGRIVPAMTIGDHPLNRAHAPSVRALKPLAHH